jgi:hypothetical protein
MGGIHRHESFMEVSEITGKLREETKIQKGTIHAIKHSCILFCFLIVTQHRILIACTQQLLWPVALSMARYNSKGRKSEGVEFLLE